MITEHHNGTYVVKVPLVTATQRTLVERFMRDECPSAIIPPRGHHRNPLLVSREDGKFFWNAWFKTYEDALRFELRWG